MTPRQYWILAYGHARQDCEGLHDELDDAGLDVLTYVGGNLAVGRSDFEETQATFDRWVSTASRRGDGPGGGNRDAPRDLHLEQEERIRAREAELERISDDQLQRIANDLETTGTQAAKSTSRRPSPSTSRCRPQSSSPKAGVRRPAAPPAASGRRFSKNRSMHAIDVTRAVRTSCRRPSTQTRGVNSREAEDGRRLSRQRRRRTDGFSAASHVVEDCRRLIRALDAPVEVRHGTPDARLLAKARSPADSRASRI